jgi:hypothetical protein
MKISSIKKDRAQIFNGIGFEFFLMRRDKKVVSGNFKSNNIILEKN